MLMLHPSDLDIRTQEHHRRVDQVNRSGWLGPNPVAGGGKPALGIVLAVAAARLVVREFLSRRQRFLMPASPQIS
jgi:hypothetical protein